MPRWPCKRQLRSGTISAILILRLQNGGGPYILDGRSSRQYVPESTRFGAAMQLEQHVGSVHGQAIFHQPAAIDLSPFQLPGGLFHTIGFLYRQNPPISRARFLPKTNIYRGSKYPGADHLWMVLFARSDNEPSCPVQRRNRRQSLSSLPGWVVTIENAQPLPF